MRFFRSGGVYPRPQGLESSRGGSAAGLPHIHVKYQEQESIFSLPEGELIEGELKSNKLKLVQAWIEIHKEELMADWELAANGQEVFKIDPLK